MLQALESGVPYGAVNTNGVDPRPYVTNPNNAYLTPPASTATTYFFGPRDEFHTEGQRRTDFARQLRAIGFPAPGGCSSSASCRC